MSRLKYRDPADGTYKLVPVGGTVGLDQPTGDTLYVNVSGGDTITGDLAVTGTVWLNAAKTTGMVYNSGAGAIDFIVA